MAHWPTAKPKQQRRAYPVAGKENTSTELLMVVQEIRDIMTLHNTKLESYEDGSVTVRFNDEDPDTLRIVI